MCIKYSSLDKLQQIAYGVALGEQGEFFVINFVAVHLGAVAQLFNDLAAIIFAEVGHFVCVMEEMITARRVKPLIEIVFAGNGGDYGNRIFSCVRADQLLNDIGYAIEVIAVVSVLGNVFG